LGRVELGLKHGLAVLVDATIPCADFLCLTFPRVSCRVGPALRSWWSRNAPPAGSLAINAT